MSGPKLSKMNINLTFKQNCNEFHSIHTFLSRKSIKFCISSIYHKGKEKVAKVIPNAILITTENEKHFLTSFTSRDKTYLMLFRVWQNALMDKPMNPQELWQWVKSKFALLSLCNHHIEIFMTCYKLLSIFEE